ncbi:hypothetical protein BGZ73_003402 [Actinomortierella ambigua]|nr:hypothetical protein BGZ73_003402 [Actinomortierella ambigua]
MDHLLYMPEFVDLMSSHLDLATLAACVRVCKAWHEICIPHLWHTFGTVPQQPLRFGNPRPPKIAPPRGTPFPLYVSSGNGSDYSPPTQIPVFSAARQEIYPWFYSNRSLVTDTMWDRFFGRYQPGVGDEEAIAAIVAKHARHIRCLVIRSQWAFGIYEHVCQQLTSLYFDTGYGDRDLEAAESAVDIHAAVFHRAHVIVQAEPGLASL